MSYEGKMKRGKKWYDQRDVNGDLPQGIKEDPNKMADVNFYLENKPKDPEPVSVIKKKVK